MDTENPISLKALDRSQRPIVVGDQIRFVMQGYFLPREQESFGKIIEIDAIGGVRIQMTSIYRHFNSKGRLAHVSREIYFVHHQYDSELGARIYSVHLGGHDLYIEKVD
jgi:hypothetical protein